ncbi:MAG TPA: hypothetical protein VGU74_17040 [Gemmatimonadales bacterium]|nr:hypothetical protein [Gemmatimonadales bacterium]
MSSVSSVNDALAGYAAGRVKAEQLVAAVTAAYYREREAERREQLRPIIELIERVHPGVVELAGHGEKPGFAVRLAERPFPKRYDAELRQMVTGLVSAPHSPLPAPSLLSKILRAIRRVFRS